MSVVRRFASRTELASGVASAWAERVAAAQADGGVPAVVLTGGSIADDIHGLLPEAAEPAGLDWTAIDFWWGDERYVEVDSPDRNAVQARRAFLDDVGADPARIHEMPADDGTPLPAAAAAYAGELRSHGPERFELVMLGVGPDGHVASLFPGSAALDVTDDETVAVPDSPKPPPARISLTFPALRRTEAVWFVVSGADKAQAVAAALGDADPHRIPAAGVTAPEVVWFLDDEAAGALP